MTVNIISEMMSYPIAEPQAKGSQKTWYEKYHGKYIHKTPNGTYTIVKSINGKMKAFGTYKNFNEACNIRDELIDRNWKPLPKTDEHYQKEYYKNIGKSGERYKVRWIDGYMGTVDSIEEALYYRDIVAEHRGECDKPEAYDLITNNPYLEGLEYPLPERLIITPRESDYGKGHIIEKGPQSYHVHHGSKKNGLNSYICACRTYEQAYYVKQEMNKVNWDKKELPRILDEYPIWYTWLMKFWQYVTPRAEGGWSVAITPRCNPNKFLERLYFSKAEDALWERDLLIKYDFDENELTEAADDNLNPYFDMEIPPYPQRKIRRIVDREPRPELLTMMKELILEGHTQEEICDIVGHNSVTVRNILKRDYNSSWSEFLKICRNGEDPNDVLEFQPLIYKPNLDYIPPNNNYVQLNKGEKRKSHYTVVYKNEYFGAYPTRKLANKISNELQKCGWDKSQLKRIQAKYGHESIVNSKRWIYETKYTSKKTGKTRILSYHIRKKDKDRKIHNYGSYKDYEVAKRVRDLLIENDWSKRELGNIIQQVKDEFGLEEI